MPTSLAGKINNSRGVTLIEMMIVVTIMSLIAGLTYPSITSGLDSLRINAASRSIVSFFNSGLNRAERRQQAIQITIDKPGNFLFMRSADPSFGQRLTLPEGVVILKVLPELQQTDDENLPRTFMLYPGGTVPPFGVLIQNRRNTIRLVQVDPMTGVPVVTQPTS
jgi:prepilin-type N-terminal cleavage/methylation domain-containing protein